MRLKYSTLVLMMMLVGSIGHTLPNPVHESVATADSISGGFVNPAVLSFGNATGVGFIQHFDDEKFTRDFELFFHTRVLGYAFSREAEADRHNLIFSMPILRNLYFGTALNTEDFQEENTSWDFGLLYRPTDFLSLGTRAVIPPGDEPRYITGAAVRPLAFFDKASHRVSLFADLPWNADGMQAPKTGLHIEPLDGVAVRLGYDFENEAFGFSLSIAVGAVRGGSWGHVDSSGGLNSGAAFIQFSPQPFNYPYATTGDIFYNYSFGPEVVETGRAFKTGPIYFVLDHYSLLDTLEELKQIEKTPYIDGLLFINSHSAMNLSTLLEIRDALLELKTSGKKIAFYSDYMTTMDYLLAASVADEIYLHPQGIVDLRGVSVSSPYFRDFFEKIGIEVANFNTGDYKSAYNFLSEASMPEAEREALAFMLEGLYSEYARLVEAGRGDKLAQEAPAVISDGPYLIAQQALDAGLVDGLVQRDELKEKVSFLSQKSVIKDRLPTSLVRSDWSDPPATKVAVIHADGPIHTGQGVPGSSIGSESLSRAIKTAREDDKVKAILLRVDSGGGSSLASDLIAREVQLCRSGEDAKPVIVSMAGTAASGGYYISAYADKIVASPAAITGSIGVIAVFPNFSGLLEKQQIRWDYVRRGPRADFGAAYRQLTEDEKNRIRELLGHTYDRFLQVVSEGRDLPVEEVKKIAGGRIWTGKQALQHGLVDATGGYEAAFEVLRETAGITGEIELVDYSFADIWGTFSLGRLPGMFLQNLYVSDHSENHEMLPKEIEYLYRYYRAVGDPERTAMVVMPYFVEGISSTY